MLHFKIHFTVDGHEDSVVVSAPTLEEIRQKADAEVEKRGGTDPWSESLEETDD